ncbi:MAG TPA: DUF2268 domain-containing putative Zn-dependent protease [Kofleriaceae bacterium]|jgi:tetratricopeptide (TPR) repeat protein|nr:DUF2268 domain-containing putative Zn-dependent protease [Kofleriaceae bacterium]
MNVRQRPRPGIWLVLAATLPIALSSGTGTAESEPRSATALASAAEQAYAAHEFQRAGELLERAIQRGAKTPTAPYQSACSYARAGDRDRAFAMLDRAVAIGFRDVDQLTADHDLAALHGDARWTPLVARVTDVQAAFRKAHADPKRARIETSDIARFWRAYDKLSSAADPATLLETEYLDIGSAGLQEFIPDRITSGQKLLQAIQHHPKYFAAIRKATQTVAAIEPEVRQELRNLQKLYADATFPDIYYVIGAMSSGGTSTPSGLVMGVELFGRGPGVPMDEMSDWHRAVIQDTAALASITAHELIHFQQNGNAHTLLERAFLEGSADFIASLISKGNFNQHIYKYGYGHEAALWRQFRGEMAGSDVSNWLYGGTPHGDRPADLGYFIGFRIAQAYYERATNKRQAIRDIIVPPAGVEKLLADSHYGQRFP